MIHRTLKDLRKSYALTQKQVSDLLKIDRSSYTCYETGKSHPPIDTLVKLSKIYNTSIDYIVLGKKEERHHVGTLAEPRIAPYGQGNNTLTLEQDELELLCNYRLLKENRKKELIQYLKTLQED